MDARIGCGRSSVVRIGLLVLGLGLLGAALATPAAGQTDVEDDGPRVVLTGRVEVPGTSRSTPWSSSMGRR